MCHNPRRAHSRDLFGGYNRKLSTDAGSCRCRPWRGGHIASNVHCAADGQERRPAAHHRTRAAIFTHGNAAAGLSTRSVAQCRCAGLAVVQSRPQRHGAKRVKTTAPHRAVQPARIRCLVAQTAARRAPRLTQSV